EWKNYRLAAGWMNSRKGVFADILDPFEVQDGWFHLEFFGFQITAAATIRDDDLKTRIEKTIERLGLNLPALCRLREEYHDNYKKDRISFDYLEERAPLVAMEMKRQSLLSKRSRQPT
ncbi:MAG: hypothetical protein AAGC55_25510, partial [Myxococcota bacterium]